MSSPSTAPPSSGPAGPGARASVFAVPLLGYLAGVQGAGGNLASTALVGASRSLDMTGSTQALAASMQSLAIAATVITTGLLADRLGRRRVLLAALVVGAVGNVIVAAAPVAAVYMLGMAVAGIGLGAVYGSAFAYIKAVVPLRGLAAAMGLFTAVLMVGTLVLTFVGGSLSSIDWRLAFVVAPVACLLGLAAVPIVLPRVDPVRGGSLDVVGQLLLGFGVVAFLYAVSGFADGLTNPRTLVPLCVGVVLLAAFVGWELRYDGHFFPMELFRSPVFLAALCFGFVYNFGTSVAFLQVTNLWQYVNGLGTSEVSLWQLPLLLAGVGSGLVTGRLMARGMSDRTAGFLGGVTAAVGFVWLGLFHASTSLLGFAPGLLLVGAGVVITAVPFGNLILRVAPAQYLGPVSSTRMTAGQFFYALGFALSTVVVDKLTTGGVVRRLEAVGVPADEIGTGLSAVNTFAARGTRPSTQLGQEALANAVTSYGTAFRTTMLLAAVAIVLVTVLATGLLRNRTGSGTDTPAPASA
ncbi:MAG: MFS transporter [Microthrixaceae bacterium]|jgi:MFS family permease